MASRVFLAWAVSVAIALGVILTAATPAHALSMNQLELLQHNKAQLDNLNREAGAIIAAAKNRSYPCQKAFGNAAFCACLANNLSVWLSFPDYIAIVTATKAQRESSALSADKKDLIAQTIKVRDKCVTEYVSNGG